MWITYEYPGDNENKFIEKPLTNAEMRDTEISKMRCRYNIVQKSFKNNNEYEQFISDLLRENYKQTKFTEFFQ